MLNSLPLDAAEFAAAMDRFAPGPGGVAVAVSGGPDSSALALLARGWARARGVRLETLTVDHRLRPDSGAEAAMVASRMRGLGLPHRILSRPEGSIRPTQDAARRVRYALLREAAADAGCDRLLLGHSRDDQAETVLWRLARGSGPDGLAAMAAERVEGGVRLLRPLLAVPKARLIATCEAAGLNFVTDPANVAPRFARTRLRASRAALAAEGMSDEHLARLAARMAVLRDTLDRLAAGLVASSVEWSPFGFARIDRAAFAAAEPEIARRALLQVVAAIGAAGHPPAFEAAAAATAGLCGAGEGGGRKTGRGASLGRCTIEMRGDVALVMREARALPEVAVPPGAVIALWDGRFDVEIPAVPLIGGDGDLRIAAWGRRAAAADLPAGLPIGAARTLPALWAGGEPVLPPLGPDGTTGARLGWAFRPAMAEPTAYPVASAGTSIMYTVKRDQASARGRPGGREPVKDGTA